MRKGRRRASRSCRAVGSWNVLSPGWADAAGCQRIGKNPSPAQRRGSPSPTFDVSHAISQGINNAQIVLNRTLRSRIYISNRYLENRTKQTIAIRQGPDRHVMAYKLPSGVMRDF